MNPSSVSRLEAARQARSFGGGTAWPHAFFTALAVVGFVLLLGTSAAGVIAVATGIRLVLLVGLVVLAWWAVSAATARFDRLERRPLHVSHADRRLPVVLERAEQRIELARSFAAHFEPLRRDLRAVADQRLARRGVRFESDEARELLGTEAWQLLAEPLAVDKFSAGIDDVRLERLVRSLEEV